MQVAAVVQVVAAEAEAAGVVQVEVVGVVQVEVVGAEAALLVVSPRIRV
jgi:hypothetical protein